MTSKGNPPDSVTDTAVPLRLVRDAAYPDLVVLLYNLSTSGRYQICLDVSAVSHLGTMEFRLLGIYAEQCRQHGGFLKLENPSDRLAALVRSYGCHELLARTAGQACRARDGVASVCSLGASGSLPEAPSA